MKAAAAVILYRPEEIGNSTIVSNIRSYAPYFDTIYIVDNSPEETTAGQEIVSGLMIDDNRGGYKITYLYNGNRGGIAGGQNKACRQAIKDGYEWIMTMDQDSFFEPEQVRTYMRLVESYVPTDEKAVSFGPKIKNLNDTIYWTKKIRFKVLSPLKRKVLGKRWRPRREEAISFPDAVIASANIIKLSAWEEVGGFDEFLFIDELDHDFCHKLKKHGYSIVQLRLVYLSHYYGKKAFSLLPKYFGNYSPFRLYHIFRNIYIERHRFPEYNRFYSIRLRQYFWDYCINTIHPIRGFRIFLRAKKDAEKFIHEDALYDFKPK